MSAPTGPGDLFDLAVLLDEHTLVLLGHCAAPLPARASVDVQGRPGRFRALCWGPAGAPAHVLAVLRAEGVGLARPGDLVLVDENGGTRAFPPVERLELGASAILRRLAAADPAALADAFDFLLAVLLDQAGGEAGGRIHRFLHAFLREISTQDGFVEIFARPECGGLFIQGWSIHLAAAQADLWTETEGLEKHEAAIAHFGRSDLLDTATGMVGFLLKADSGDPAAIRRFYFRSPAGYHHLSIVDAPARIEAADATRHVAAMLPKLEGPPAMRAAFKRICRPRFEGHETMSALPRPVRAAIDASIRLAGEGYFVSGWMLDPAHVVSRVLLKSTGGFYERIDLVWSRLARPDVSGGFAADPAIGPKLMPGDDAHGFVVFVPHAQAGEGLAQFYLEIVVEDEEAGFLPVTWSPAAALRSLHDMVAPLDLDDPAIESMIARHLAGVMADGSNGGAAAPVPAAEVSFGTAAEPQVSILLSAPALGSELEVSLARLAGDPEIARAELVIVAPKSGAERQVGRFRRLAEFYRLNGRLLLTAQPIDRHRALDLAARQARAEHIVMLGLNVLPKEFGWIRRLARELGGSVRSAAASPTLVYEDFSIRYAGRDPVLDDAGPAKSGGARFHGYSRHWLERQRTTTVGAITSECCLMPRRAFIGLGGFGRDLVGPTYKDDDFSLRLRAAGGQCIWVPAVELFALDDEVPGAERDQWAKACRLVDRARFSSKWSGARPAGGLQS